MLKADFFLPVTLLQILPNIRQSFLSMAPKDGPVLLIYFWCICSVGMTSKLFLLLALLKRLGLYNSCPCQKQVPLYHKYQSLDFFCFLLSMKIWVEMKRVETYDGPPQESYFLTMECYATHIWGWGKIFLCCILLLPPLSFCSVCLSFFVLYSLFGWMFDSTRRSRGMAIRPTNKGIK